MPNTDPEPGEQQAKLTPADIFVPREPVQKAAKKAAKAEANQFQLPTRAQLARKGLQDHLQRLQQEHGLRVMMAVGIFLVCLAWLMFVGFVLFLQGLFHGYIFSVSDSIMIAFLATTTVNVLGLLATVIRYLFPRNANGPSSAMLESDEGSRSQSKKPHRQPDSACNYKAND
jgi:hypothetical protein